MKMNERKKITWSITPQAAPTTRFSAFWHNKESDWLSIFKLKAPTTARATATSIAADDETPYLMLISLFKILRLFITFDSGTVESITTLRVDDKIDFSISFPNTMITPQTSPKKSIIKK